MYSYACVVFHIITQKKPFHDKQGGADLVAAIKKGEPQKFPKKLQKEWVNFLKKNMSVDREKRSDMKDIKLQVYTFPAPQT